MLSTPRVLREGEGLETLEDAYGCDEEFERGMGTMRREVIKMHSLAFVSETQCKRVLKIVSEFIGSSIHERGAEVRVYLPNVGIELNKQSTNPWHNYLRKETTTARAMQYYQYSREWGPTSQHYLGPPTWNEDHEWKCHLPRRVALSPYHEQGTCDVATSSVILWACSECCKVVENGDYLGNHPRD